MKDLLLILGVFSVFYFLLLSHLRRVLKKRNMRSNLIKKYNLLDLGTLIHGHPDVDNNCEICLGSVDNNNLILNKAYKDNVINIAYIPKEAIANISVLDQTTFENTETWMRQSYIFKKYTIAFHNKIEHTLVYLIIKWNDGRFDHETVFAYSNSDAMNTANKVRNILIRMLR
jgi:hypothetical protein